MNFSQWRIKGEIKPSFFFFPPRTVQLKKSRIYTFAQMGLKPPKKKKKIYQFIFLALV